MNLRLSEAPASQESGRTVHAAWIRLFAYAASLGEGVISRVVVQDSIPVFMEHALNNVSLQKGSYLYESPFPKDQGECEGGFSPEWSLLYKIAADLGYCEFRDLRICDGAPVSIGELVNKEKLS